MRRTIRAADARIDLRIVIVHAVLHFSFFHPAYS